MKSNEVIVDVDNTLCDYSPVFYDELRKINPNVPSCLNWDHWNFYDGYMKDEEFYHAAHLAQMRIMECNVIPKSDYLLRKLKDRFKVVIASNRRDESLDLLIEWLNFNNLIYDDIYISMDKTKIFDEFTEVVVDDSPITLKYAHDRGILSTGLEYPWNRVVGGNGIYLGKNLVNITDYIFKECG
jgi:FMN phosphatase YigB (HAD superfamily)